MCPTAPATWCLHICGNLNHFVGHVLGGQAYRRDRAKEFSAKGLPKEELLGEVDRAIIAVDVAMRQLTGTTLEAPYPIPTPVDAESTCHFLLHLYGHLNYHLGQVNYLRRTLVP
ncbi:MAG: hypothetical protein KJZ58_14240 [Flavobacteriales bacterium]|nr:hypothetical protein [Flavobacteriales bacterium]